MPNPGDTVKVVTKKETIEGVLMPSFDEQVVLLKLDTGYNIGLEKKDITKIMVVKPAAKIIPKKEILEVNPQLPTIAILHTGGTIASKVDYRTGGVTAAFSPSQLLDLFPELKMIANIESELIAQMWSDDLRFAHFPVIAKAIEKYIKKGAAGIIIGMGTDNLAVASAGSADAGMNLICAAQFITKSDFAGVAICMHAHEDDDVCSILPATKTYKLHSSRRDAFKAVNSDAIASVGYKERVVHMIAKEYERKGKEKLVLKSAMEDKVGLLKIHVNMFPEQFELFQGYKGLVIEGKFPILNARFIRRYIRQSRK
ncbi:asparaginase [Candidatus Woesearchaeota archaeon]|nr:asparaginase [Candidatus Woesearchaeota archaeon]